MKILVVSEFHILNTGYATYYKNICQALHNAGHEVVELASYGDSNKPDHVKAATEAPWNVYLNIPPVSDRGTWANYQHAKKTKFATEFGSWNFDSIVLAEKPDVVLAIRDHWYDKFIIDSPLSRYYVSILSPTIDAMPQRAEWIDTFKFADVITAYNQWSEDWIRKQTGLKNIVKHIPPAPNDIYKPMNKDKARTTLGIKKDAKILLTVMRNQIRKRYPELFDAISKINDPNIYLYCHCHHMDHGWDLASLALQYGVGHKVLFSFKCNHCYKISTKLFNTNAKCERCGGPQEICSIDNGATNDDLNTIYNAADLYVQWHNSEGFGIPTIEAASAGLKVITVTYSAQEDVAGKIDSFPIPPKLLEREIGNLCYRAIPDNDKLIELLNDPNTWQEYDREKVSKFCRENYNWENTGKAWVKLIENITPKNNWEDSPVLKSPPSFERLKNLNNYDFVMSCILDVLQDPRYVGSYVHSKTLDELETGISVPDDSATGKKQNIFLKVTKEMVYQRFFQMLEEKVLWERRKNQTLNAQ